MQHEAAPSHDRISKSRVTAIQCTIFRIWSGLTTKCCKVFLHLAYATNRRAVSPSLKHFRVIPVRKEANQLPCKARSRPCASQEDNATFMRIRLSLRLSHPMSWCSIITLYRHFSPFISRQWHFTITSQIIVSPAGLLLLISRRVLFHPILSLFSLKSTKIIEVKIESNGADPFGNTPQCTAHLFGA